ncbi:MAG: glucose-1-phosphate thymidylyltransferase [Candidatus Nanohaloarchaea archaeon]|jgi:glucose-1-phosphate thymidylyltransferase
MKAIILAGGHATRLWPITKNRAKPLLPLGEKPIIEYIIEGMSEEVDEIIISTNEKFSEDFEDYTDEYGRENARVVVENQDSEEEKPGTIGAIINLIETENLNDNLLIVGGDNYYSFDIDEFVRFAREKDTPANVVYDVGSKEKAQGFGIVDTDSDKITDFKEKPNNPPSTLASTACYYFPKDQLSLFNEYEEHFKKTELTADQYLDEPGRLIEWAHNQTPMHAYSFEGDWFDIGTVEGYLDSTKALIGDSLIEGEVEDTRIGENVVIMEGAKVVNSRLDNTIVFPDAHIEDSEVRRSIIDNDVEIANTELNDAVLGEHSNL